MYTYPTTQHIDTGVALAKIPITLPSPLLSSCTRLLYNKGKRLEPSEECTPPTAYISHLLKYSLQEGG